jgi:tetratricopeptide (TPR) repeat protein
MEDCNIAIRLAYSNIPHKGKEQLVESLLCKARLLEALQKYEKVILAYEEIMDIKSNTSMMDCIRKCMVLYKKKTEEEAEANISEVVKELREQERKKKAEEAERMIIEKEVDTKIYEWKKGKEGDFKALVCSLDLVLWPEAQIKGVEMKILSDAKKCKIVYCKAILKIHPDKAINGINIFSLTNHNFTAS